MRWSLKQHEDQHAHGFGKDIKDRAIWVRVLKPQEVRKERQKEKKREKDRKKGRKEGTKKERKKERKTDISWWGKKTVNFTDYHK